MSFASPVFLWYFLPLTLGLVWVLPDRHRNAVVALASLLFYAVGGGALTLLLLALIGLNFGSGRALDRLEAAAVRRAVVVGTVVVDLSCLAVWKYAGFATRQADRIAETLGLGSVDVVRLALPIGISFYVFHQISYVVDIYRRDRPALRSPLDFATYVCMFPQLIAGPIVRFHEIADQLPRRTTSKWDDLVDGFPRFCLGLTKKVVIADSLAPVADATFGVSFGELTTGAAWLGIAAYTLQIYFDFSGYSDMAIGLGRMLGFQLPENFARPYSAHSITDFWRRWHMSLSRWFRDYVYIPLGGNRGGTALTYRNLVTVFLLCGLWHGASWTFVVWGGYHGALLVLERVLGLPATARTPAAAVVRRAVVMLLVAVGWVFFRAGSMGQAWAFLGRMFSWHGGPLPDPVAVEWTNQAAVVLLAGLLVLLLPARFVMGSFVQFGRRRWADVARVGYSSAGLAYSCVLLAAGTFSPFLYYQF